MQRSQPADDHDDERVQQPLAVLAGATSPCEAPTTPPNAARAEPTTNATAKVELDADAERRRHLAVVDPARITIPVRVR